MSLIYLDTEFAYVFTVTFTLEIKPLVKIMVNA